MNTFLNAALPVIFGFVLHKLLALMRRKRDSRNTPFHFDWKFWWHDNWISIAFYAILNTAIVFGLPEILDAVAGFKHTPKQVADIVEALPLRLAFFGSGFFAAMPISWFEKKTRDVKRKAGLMKK